MTASTSLNLYIWDADMLILSSGANCKVYLNFIKKFIEFVNMIYRWHFYPGKTGRLISLVYAIKFLNTIILKYSYLCYGFLKER